MENRWLCVTNEENWLVIIDREVWGVSDRYRRAMGEVCPDDTLVFYVKPKRIWGIFKATSKPFQSRKRVFRTKESDKHEVIPHRVELEPIILPIEPLGIERLIPKLGFIANKKYWTGHLRRAMRKIPEDDYELIKSLLEKHK